jgi:hypothetical protein
MAHRTPGLASDAQAAVSRYIKGLPGREGGMMPETGWYWVPGEEAEKVAWHPAFYDRERGRMWIAECKGSGWVPRPEDLRRPAAMPGVAGEADLPRPGVAGE